MFKNIPLLEMHGASSSASKITDVIPIFARKTKHGEPAVLRNQETFSGRVLPNYGKNTIKTRNGEVNSDDLQPERTREMEEETKRG